MAAQLNHDINTQRHSWHQLPVRLSVPSLGSTPIDISLTIQLARARVADPLYPMNCAPPPANLRPNFSARRR